MELPICRCIDDVLKNVVWTSKMNLNDVFEITHTRLKMNQHESYIFWMKIARSSSCCNDVLINTNHELIKNAFYKKISLDFFFCSNFKTDINTHLRTGRQLNRNFCSTERDWKIQSREAAKRMNYETALSIAIWNGKSKLSVPK